ncbi:aminodeoxychorismate lyase [Evansella sp. AB-rgal1]|uniref:aminodeoxychorismate lyase n=1 Tax=Evansella sp. AB-rgal1 TaxID=3242696 RepID=UPI00359D4F22
MYIYVNGSILDSTEATISPFDHGYLYGLGLFETFRTYHGHPFLLDDHFHRLYESANELGIVLPPYERGKIVGIIQNLLRKNNLEDGYFRWNVSAGEREIGLSTDLYESPTTIAFVKGLPQSFSSEKEAIILAQRRNTPEGSSRLKSHHYLNNIIGKREVGMNPSLEGIFLSEHGHVSEGVVSNIFWYKKSTLYTPSMESGALNGITRQFIISLAKKLDLKVEVGLYEQTELEDAEEVFVSNSIQELVSIQKLAGYSYPGSKGMLFTKLKKEYQQYTENCWSRLELLKG